MLAQSALLNWFWPYALLTAIYLKNISFTQPLGQMTPFEVFHEDKPEHNHLRVWGCFVSAHINDKSSIQHKFVPHTKYMIFVQYSLTKHNYIVFDPHTRKDHIITSLKFFEHMPREFILKIYYFQLLHQLPFPYIRPSLYTNQMFFYA